MLSFPSEFFFDLPCKMLNYLEKYERKRFNQMLYTIEGYILCFYIFHLKKTLKHPMKATSKFLYGKLEKEQRMMSKE